MNSRHGRGTHQKKEKCEDSLKDLRKTSSRLTSELKGTQRKGDRERDENLFK